MLTTRTVFEVTALKTPKVMQISVSDDVQADPITRPTIASVSLGETARLLEPFIVGHEIVSDKLHESVVHLADAQYSYLLLMRELQQRLDDFEHPKALTAFNSLKIKSRAQP